MSSRIDKVRALLKSRELDCIIVQSSRSRRYISGFTGSAGIVLVLPDKCFLLTDFRYMQQASAETAGCEVLECSSKIYEQIAGLLTACSKIGYEYAHVTVETFERMKKALGGKVWTSVNLDTLRAIKENEELLLIKKAVAVADRAFARLLPELKTGMAEIEAAALLEFYLRKEGASGTSFSTIVASGERSSLPHGQPTEKLLTDGDFVTFDFGAIYGGYCSDITRTLVMGKANARQKEIYGIVLAAQKAALSSLKPGMTGIEGDALARDVINSAGYGKLFGHGTGHSLGLAIHEEPRLSPGCETVLKPGMVLTVEPGIYVPGWGGVRIEDVVVLTESGLEILTATPKELLELSN